MYKILTETGSIFMSCNDPEAINLALNHVPTYSVQFPNGEIMDAVKASYYLETA